MCKRGNLEKILTQTHAGCIIKVETYTTKTCSSLCFEALSYTDLWVILKYVTIKSSNRKLLCSVPKEPGRFTDKFSKKIFFLSLYLYNLWMQSCGGDSPLNTKKDDLEKVLACLVIPYNRLYLQRS